MKRFKSQATKKVSIFKCSDGNFLNRGGMYFFVACWLCILTKKSFVRFLGPLGSEASLHWTGPVDINFIVLIRKIFTNENFYHWTLLLNQWNFESLKFYESILLKYWFSEFENLPMGNKNSEKSGGYSFLLIIT